MAKLPTVAIIGRPNTGKSTLFNRFIGRRRAIVSEIAGTTRDHIAERIEGAIPYLLVDTGGMGASSDKQFEDDVYQQSLLALENADVIVLTLNGREELTKDDHEIIKVLRKQKRRHVPVIVIVTKIDTPRMSENAPDVHSLGIGDRTLMVSAMQNQGMDELDEAITEQLEKVGFKKNEEKEEIEGIEGDKEIEEGIIPRIAIIGKPNAGKSSLVNAMMSDVQRKKSPLLVSPVAGTTRDSTDTEIRHEGKPYILVDTAGLKKHARTTEQIERYSMLRTIQAIESADIAVLVIDATEPASQQDKRIARMAMDAGKGLILVLNKIDTVKSDVRLAKIHEIGASFSFAHFAHFLPASAKTREGLLKLFALVDSTYRSMRLRISTPKLQRWLEETVSGKPLPTVSRCKYMTQADAVPPTFVLFVKDTKRVQASEVRYIENRMRETFGFSGTPIRIVTKTTSQKEKDKS